MFFSILREKAGMNIARVALHKKATGEDLLDTLCEKYTALLPYRNHIRLAVNESYAQASVPLEHGDHVALITPVSGG